jgi:hypothetical protein
MPSKLIIGVGIASGPKKFWTTGSVIGPHDLYEGTGFSGASWNVPALAGVISRRGIDVSEWVACMTFTGLKLVVDTSGLAALVSTEPAGAFICGPLLAAVAGAVLVGLNLLSKPAPSASATNIATATTA